MNYTLEELCSSSSISFCWGETQISSSSYLFKYNLNNLLGSYKKSVTSSLLEGFFLPLHSCLLPHHCTPTKRPSSYRAQIRHYVANSVVARSSSLYSLCRKKVEKEKKPLENAVSHVVEEADAIALLMLMLCRAVLCSSNIS